ncbi:MAG: PKD domain-containing protein, partial [Verrucomicrobiota bacterium]|nr:PKD domain-containing protein [Verrucomicrobiota bacterium]
TSCQMHSPNDRNLLDFMDATVDAQGRMVVGYPDGCVGACVNATGGARPNSYTALASVARQSGGRRLFAAYDPNPAEPTVPAAPRVDSVTKDAANIVHVAWSAPDNSGSAITGYNIYRRPDPGTYSAPIATVPGNVTTYDDAIPDPNASYFYKVTALNALGEGANCNEFTISAPPPTNRCVVPGYLVTIDPIGDQTLGPDNNRDLDVQSVSISEPVQSDNINRLIFTMRVTDLSTIQPNRQWYMIWTPPTPPATTGTDRYYVAMKSNTGGAAAVTYEYGALTSNGNVPVKLGDADAGTFTANGLIEIAIANSKVGDPAANAQLNVISGRNFAGTGDGTVTKSSAIDSTADGSYTLAGNAACRVNHAPIAALAANATSGVAPLVVTFDASGSSDPDTGDSIASYTFDFGDGSASVTQASPTAMHTYNTNGSFNATVRVTDNNGKVSDNVASAVIEVQSTLSGAVSRKAHGTAGTFDINLAISGGQGIECRTNNASGNHQLIFSFARPVTNVTSATVSRGNGSVSSRAADPSDARQYIVNLTGVTDAQVINVSLNGVQDGTGANMNVTVPVGFLVGDINADNTVNAADATIARNGSGQLTNASNFRTDVNADGTINSADATIVRNRSGSGFVPSP